MAGSPLHPQNLEQCLEHNQQSIKICQDREIFAPFLYPWTPACLYTRPAAPVRPAQSLDDLARTAALPAGLLGSGGGFKACSVAGSWVCPRPLARSNSENVYEAIQDVRDPPTEQRPEQVRYREPGAGRPGRGLLPPSKSPDAGRPPEP